MRSPLLFLGALMVVALTTALVAPFFIDWSAWRHQIEAYAEQATGRSVTIAGDVSIRLLPSPRIVLSDVRIANPPDTVSDRFVSARSVDIDMALGPLLKGRVEVTSLVVDGAVFQFEHMGSGFGNWTVEPTGGGLISADNVSIRSAVIRDSTVYLRDGTRDGSAELTDVDLVVTAQSLAGPYSLSGTVRHEDVPVDVDISTGRRSSDGDLRLSVRLVQDGGLGPTYAFEGMHATLGAEPGLEGRLTIARPMPRPGEGDGGVLPFAFRANLKGTLASFAFSDISLLLDQSNAATEITGALWVDIGETLELTAEFAAGHLDLDGLVRHAGMQIEDLVPDIALIDALPSLFDNLPGELDAVVRMHAGALTLAGETVEAARLDASYAERVLVIDELSGRVPGRGELEVREARYDAGLEDPAFRGAFELTTRDTRGFARWALPSLGDWLEARPRGLRGSSTVSGDLIVDGRAVALSDAHLEHGGTIVDGGVAFEPGERPRLDLVLAVSALALDPFVANAAEQASAGVEQTQRFEAVRDFMDDLVGTTAPQIAAQMDGSIELNVGEISWNRLRGGPVTLRGATRDGIINVSEFAVRGFHDLDVSGNARMAWTDAVPTGGVWFEFSSPHPDNLLDLVAWPHQARMDEAQARTALRRAAPLRLGVALSTGGEQADLRTEIELDADLGGVNLAASGIVLGAWSELEQARLDLEGRVLSPGSDALLTLIGLPALLGEQPGARREVATFSILGVLADGATSTLDMHLYDAHGRAEGVSEWVDGKPVTRAAVSLESGDATMLLRALGLEGAAAGEAGEAMSLEGRVALEGSTLTVHSLGGAVGSNAVGFSGSVDLDGAAGKVLGAVTLSRASLPWLAEQALGTRRGISDLITSGVLQTAAVWNSLPFAEPAIAGLDLDLSFDVGELMVDAETALEGASGRLRFAAGDLVLEGVQGTLFDGDLTLDAAFDNTGGEIVLDMRYGVVDAALGRAIADAQGAALVDGRLSVGGTLHAAGRSPLGLVSSLAGEGSFTLRAGALEGVDPEAFAAAFQLVAEPGDLDALMAEVLTRGAMPFDGLSGGFKVQNGQLRVAPAGFEGAAAHGSAGGQADLTAWQLDAQWKLSLDEYPDAPAFSVLHKGDLGAAERSYDLASLHSYLVVRGLSEGVRRLEEMQRREEMELARIEELERRAAAQAAARALAQSIARQDALRRAREAEMDAAGRGSDPAGGEIGAAPGNIAALPGDNDPEIVDDAEPAAPVGEGDVEIIELPDASDPGGTQPATEPTVIVPARPAAPQRPATAQPAPEPESVVRQEPQGSDQSGLFSNDPMETLR